MRAHRSCWTAPLIALLATAAAGEARAADAAALPVAVAPSDPGIRLVGRFDRSGPNPQFAWPGTAIEFTFQGTDANAILADYAWGGAHTVAGLNDNYFNVVVDGGAPAVLPLEKGTTIYRVASGLAPGAHRVLLYKRTESFVGKVAFHGLQLSAGGTLGPRPPAPERRIEIIGDSISAGFGNESTNRDEQFSPLTENNYLSYGALTARWLGAEASIIAWSGIGAYRDYGGSTANQMPQRFRTVLPDDVGETWNFSSWTAGAVVINLGTNDSSQGDPGWPFVEAYAGLLRDVRARYPAAPIIVCLGPLLSEPALSQMRGHLDSAITASGIENVSLLEFPKVTAEEGWGASWHPSLQTHARMASQLTREIRLRTGWRWDPPNEGGFVRVEGTHLMLNGGRFFFSGANSYSTLYSELDAEEQFRIARALGLNAMRIWGFWNGEAAPGSNADAFGHTVLQPQPGVFPEEAWRKLDYVVYLAHTHGMKLIVALNNEWNEFGGINKYLEWAGYDIPVVQGGHYARETVFRLLRPEFWTNPTCRQLYRDYVRQMLTRVNTYTGLAYKDDPAIMIWEVSNEPRYGGWGSNPDASAVASWIQDSAAFIKSIDSNHLVATGEEGFLNAGENSLGRHSYPWEAASGEGVSFLRNARLPAIDVLTIHAWPFQWNIQGEYPNLDNFVPEWTAEHLKLANQVGKPLYLGEFGWQILRRPGSDVPERDRIMSAAYAHARDTDIAGVAVWHITASHNPQEAVFQGDLGSRSLTQSTYSDDSVPHDLDFRFDIYCPEDATTCALISDFSAAMTSKVEFPDPAYVPPCLAPWTSCGSECVLLDSHPEHCGACGNPCEADETCKGGKCMAVAPVVAPPPPPAEGGGCSAGSGPPAALFGALSALALLAARRRR